MVVEELFDEPLAEVEEKGWDAPYWHAVGVGLGWLKNVEILGTGIADLIEPHMPNENAQRWDNNEPGPLMDILTDIAGMGLDIPVLGVRAGLRMTDAAINYIEFSTGEDMDADEIVGRIDSWAESKAGKEAIWSALAIFRAVKGVQALQTAHFGKSAAGGNTILTLSEFMDIIHLLAENEELAKSIDVAGYYEGLDQSDKLRLIAHEVKGLGHYLKRLEKTYAGPKVEPRLDAQSTPEEVAPEATV